MRTFSLPTIPTHPSDTCYILVLSLYTNTLFRQWLTCLSSHYLQTYPINPNYFSIPLDYLLLAGGGRQKGGSHEVITEPPDLDAKTLFIGGLAATVAVPGD